MLRVSDFALTLVILTARSDLASAACEEGVVSTFTGVCNYANFIGGLQGTCTEAEVAALLLDPDEPDLTPQEGVEALCEYDAHVQFVEIQGTYQKDRRYFAGGGILVDGEDWDVDTARIRRFEDNLADHAVINFPEYAARMQYNEDNDLGENGYPANMNLDTGCELNTIMCCFTDDTKMSGSTFADNDDTVTDVCHHDLHDSPQSNHIKAGWSVFLGSETSTHCVGFTWSEGEEDLPGNVLGNMMYDVSLQNSINKGYLKGIPGGPMCGCVENMPVVERADCRTASAAVGTYTFSADADLYLTASSTAAITYGDCDEPDLAAQVKANTGSDAIDAHLVGDGGCPDENVDYLNDEQFLLLGRHETKYVDPDPSVWSDVVVGEGVYFQPPNVDPLVADAEFRDLIDGGCVDSNGDPRKCIIYRNCASCTSAAHRHIYYRRLTPLPPPGTNTTAGESYFLDLFMNHWYSAPANEFNVDFELYSALEDAIAGDQERKWVYCNFNHHGVGFPRDCGPYGYVGDQWNSYTVHGHGSANHHGFHVERAPAAATA